MKNKASFVLMYIAFFIYSLSGICLKFASKNEFLSLRYLLFLGGAFFILACYAVLWQLVLKKIQLSVAMANKPVTLILSILWSVLLFSEHLTIYTYIGIILILMGIFVIGKSE